jgi:uncharacterized repeat protein (TIGR01451 family)
MKKRLINAWQRRVIFLVCLWVPMLATAQIRTIENNRVCNDLIVGSNTELSTVSGSLLSLGLLVNGPNIINGSSTDFATVALNAGVAGSTTIVGVRDLTQYYPAGNRAGFVIGESNGLLGLVSASVLNNLRIETYRNGTLQESATIGGSSPIQVGTLPSASSAQIVSFITTQDFDEIRLVTIGAVTATVSDLRIYYAFEEPASCPINCVDALVGAGFTQTSEAGGICLSGLPPLPVNPIANAAGVVDADSAGTPATISTFVGISCSGTIQVASPTVYPAGYEAGFAIQNTSGLLSAGVLSGITIRTYLGNTLRETKTGSALVAANLLGNAGPVKVGFKTTQTFDRIEIFVNGGIVGVSTSTNIFYAYVIADSDGDGIADCRDTCPLPSSSDTDGDGIFDACDPNTASISIVKTTNATPPSALNDQVTFTITVTKDSLTATGLVITDTFMPGLSYVSHTAPAGTNYNVATGEWTIGSALSDPNVNELALTIVANVDSIGVSTNLATITAINELNFSADTSSSACVTVPIEICQGQSVLLTAPDGLSSYQWFNGSDPIPGATEQTYLATATGQYLFNANSTQGCATGNCCPVYVNVNPAPVGNIAGDTLICSTESTTLTASGGTSYLWSTGATTPEITVTPATTTTYTVIVSNAGGCTDTVSVTVRVSQPITASTVTVCNSNNTPNDDSDDTFTFTLNPAGGSGTTFSISGAVTASNLAYGVPFQSQAFLISGGNLTLTLTDDLTGCTQIIQITPPANCSACPPKICLPISVTIRRQ